MPFGYVDSRLVATCYSDARLPIPTNPSLSGSSKTPWCQWFTSEGVIGDPDVCVNGASWRSCRRRRDESSALSGPRSAQGPSPAPKKPLTTAFAELQAAETPIVRACALTGQSPATHYRRADPLAAAALGPLHGPWLPRRLPLSTMRGVDRVACEVHEGRLALAVGAGLQVMAAMMEADMTAALWTVGSPRPRPWGNPARSRRRVGDSSRTPKSSDGWPWSGCWPGCRLCATGSG
jgi:hypothetical protein